VPTEHPRRWGFKQKLTVGQHARERATVATFGAGRHRALLAVGSTRVTGTGAAAREVGPGQLMAVARARDARTTTAVAEGVAGAVASVAGSIARNRVEWGQPWAQNLQARPLYPVPRRTAGRGRRTDLASHESYQSASSPTID